MAQTVPAFLFLYFSSNPVRVAVPCFCSAGRGPLAKSRPHSSCAWPIFAAHRGGCLQKPEHCAKHSSLVRPQDAVAVFAPAPPRCICRRQRSAAQPSAPSGAPAACGRGPLALSQFSLRAAVRPCENWSAAPASPRCICRRQRSAQLPPVGGLWASDCFLHRSASRRIVCPKLCRSPAGFRFPPSRP